MNIYIALRFTSMPISIRNSDGLHTSKSNDVGCLGRSVSRARFAALSKLRLQGTRTSSGMVFKVSSTSLPAPLKNSVFAAAFTYEEKNLKF